MLTKLIIAAALALSVSALDATNDPPENNKLLNKYKLAVVRKNHNADWLAVPQMINKLPIPKAMPRKPMAMTTFMEKRASNCFTRSPPSSMPIILRPFQ